ncbi:MAG: hypothetical protein ICV64_03810 [Thermoleophilia bacterium]|nr:hypothetical protein [Thermoleophilia bacterium]
MTRTRTLLIGAAALVAVGAGGGAVAAAKLGSPRAESDAIVEDAARQLGVEPERLRSALQRALSNRVDAAVRDGRLSAEQAQRLKERIAEGELPLFRGPRRGFHGRPGFGLGGPRHSGKLDAAADYLGLSAAELRRELGDGKTLAALARERDRSVDGLVGALTRRFEERLDAAVRDGRLSAEEKRTILARLERRIEAVVNGEQRGWFGRDGRGRRGSWAPGRP